MKKFFACRVIDAIGEGGCGIEVIMYCLIVLVSFMIARVYSEVFSLAAGNPNDMFELFTEV